MSNKEDDNPMLTAKRTASDAQSAQTKKPSLALTTKEEPTDKPKRSLFKAIGKKLKGKSSAKQSDATLKEALEEVLEEHEQSAIMMAPEEKTMLRNMLEFGDLTVSDIMIPRTDIMAIEEGISLEELKKHIMEQRHTRIPVYDETLDNVRGFIHIKDFVSMLSGDEPFNLNTIIRQMPFVPPSMKIIDLLFTMRHSGSHMAIVIDEYGGTDGLVTMEDLVEEIVGEIQDEHDNEETQIQLQWVNDNTMDVDARIRIEQLEEELKISLLSEEDDEDFDTLGGLIFFQLGRIPARGEIVQHSASNLKFEIIEADPRRIKKVRISKPKQNMVDHTG